MKKELSKLSQVELRTVWNHEATDFTTWLAEPINLELLCDEIGIPIKLIKTEADVGKFNVDILAEEENSGRKIIIENQLENTDHDHLGKIITYASGYDAEIVIWIVKSAREEHQKAVEWLNEHTDEAIKFFLINLELWQIDDSNPAVKFNVLVSPNEWAKSVKSYSGGALTDTKMMQQQFWTNFKEYVNRIDINMKLHSPRPQHWFNVSLGSSEAHISLTINTKENSLGCEVYISRNKQLYEFLKGKEQIIEQKLGSNLEWIDAKIASRILLRKRVENALDNAQFESYFQWYYKNIKSFRDLFGKLIKEFNN